MPIDDTVEGLLRRLAPQVLVAVTRRYGHFDAAEDAVQEALFAAVTQWPRDGRPDDPRAWLITVAARRLTDQLRSEQSRRRREDTAHSWRLGDEWFAPPADQHRPAGDDTLLLLFLCCHPCLTPASQIALTLRAVGGLTTAEIARAFLVPEDTMTRRIGRAKQRLKDTAAPFAMPAETDWAGRLDSVLHVLYLIFNEGYTSTSGPVLHRHELSNEAIRLTRLVHGATTRDPEVSGLLALMLLTDARRPARTAPDGTLIPMHEQDRGAWSRAYIAEGVRLVSDAMAQGPVGAYQLQAAIAALHDEAPSVDETDWRQIAGLYEVLLSLSDNPVVALNHAVAVAMYQGPRVGLDLLDGIACDRRIADDHRVEAVRGHLHEMTGDSDAARTSYRAAAQRTTNPRQQRYLLARAARLGP